MKPSARLASLELKAAFHQRLAQFYWCAASRARERQSPLFAYNMALATWQGQQARYWLAQCLVERRNAKEFEK